MENTFYQWQHYIKWVKFHILHRWSVSSSCIHIVYPNTSHWKGCTALVTGKAQRKKCEKNGSMWILQFRKVWNKIRWFWRIFFPPTWSTIRLCYNTQSLFLKSYNNLWEELQQYLKQCFSLSSHINACLVLINMTLPETSVDRQYWEWIP